LDASLVARNPAVDVVAQITLPKYGREYEKTVGIPG
jgi:hypothetical protein